MAIQMEFPNNGADEVPSDHLLTPNKAFSAGSRLHPIVVGQSGPIKIQSSYKIIQALPKYRLLTNRQQGPTAEDITHTTH